MFKEILRIIRLILEMIKGPSERTKWEREYKRLLDEYDRKKKAYEEAFAGSDIDDCARAYSCWMLASKTLAAHRLAGVRQGFLDRSQ